MRTDHEELCGSTYGSFCLNGGICYMIPTISSPFCSCPEVLTNNRQLVIIARAPFYLTMRLSCLTAASSLGRCVEHYTGARCEEIFLPSIKSQARGELFAAVLASVVFLSVLVAGVFFFLCRKGQISRASSTERGDNLIAGSGSNDCSKITE